MPKAVKYILIEEYDATCNTHWTCKTKDDDGEVLETGGDTPNDAVSRMMWYRERLLAIRNHLSGKTEKSKCTECTEQSTSHGILKKRVEHGEAEEVQIPTVGRGRGMEVRFPDISEHMGDGEDSPGCPD
jgi:hypothetical protein